VHRWQSWSGYAVAPVLVAAWLALGSAPAWASGSFTWTGASTSPDWSNSSNWSGGTPGGSVSSLIFPATLTGATCPSDTCYAGTDDVSGLTTDGVTIDDGTGYDVDGSDPLGLGANGIDATTAASNVDASTLAMPIALSSSQNWSIDGGASGAGYLVLTGGVSGPGDTLGIGLENAGYLDFDDGSDNEVGAIAATGDDPSQTGLNSYNNGALELGAGAKLNEGGGNAIRLTHAALFGEGEAGSVTSDGGVVTAGDPLGTLTLAGLTLDSASALQFAIAGGGTTAGVNYSQLAVQGNVDLGGSTLDVTGTDVNNDCPTLTPGSNYTLLDDTDGTFTGVFANVYQGEVIQMDCNGTSPYLRISYGVGPGSGTVIATVVSAPPAANSLPTYVNVFASPTSATAGSSVRLAALVVSSSFGPLAGSVEFEDGSASIAGCADVAVSAPPSLPYTMVSTFIVAECMTTFSVAGTTL